MGGGASRRKGGRRAARIALLLALNAALLALLWTVAAPRLFAKRPAKDAQPATAVASSAPPADVIPAPLASRRDRALEGKLRAAVQSALAEAESASKGRVKAGACAVAVHVRAAEDGAEIASIGAERAQRPASNLKLVTTGAALVLLGPDWTFRTLFASDAPVEGGTLKGDLVVRAGGDPLLDPAAHGDVARMLEPVVAQLAALGIARVAGDLVLDEGRFLDPGAGPSWPAENQRWDDFCALSGGFSANAGCLTARVVPAKAGQPARVEVRPLGHGMPTRIDVATGKARSKLDVRVSAVGGTVVVTGTVPADVESWECRFAAPDPVALFGGALRHALAARGISIAGAVRRERSAPNPRARLLAKLETPVLSVLEPINAHSNNAVADQLYFALGDAQFGRGDREGGRLATSLALQRLGVPDDGFRQVDGSGLSRDNHVSARQVTALLAGVLRRGGSAARALLDSMAAPRADGTLDDRLAGLEGRVRAKTGFIGGTSALSGVIENDAGRSVCFSILVEYPVTDGLNTRVWKPMQDKLCRILAGTSQ